MNFLKITGLDYAKPISAVAGKIKYMCLLGLCLVLLPGSVLAEEADTSWGFWFRSQVNQHPDIIAAREKMQAALSMADSLDQPLYNPELDTEYEREGRDNNYRLGLSQTIDWWGKRDQQRQQATFGRKAARRAFELTLQQKSAEALQAVVDWNAARAQAGLARTQEEQLDTLLTLVKGRQQSGDLGQVDVELAFLGLSQKLNDAAQAQARMRQAEARLEELLPDWSVRWKDIPETLWANGERGNMDQWVEQHPAVTAARAEWEVTKKMADLARLRGKAEPTVGLNGGKSSGSTVVGVTLSIPLNVRNNFSAQARAASRESFAAEASYRAVQRRQLSAIRASTATLEEYEKRYLRWQTLMEGRAESSGDLLEKQWRSGDMSTTEYLLSLQQRTQGLIAGIELHTQYQMARIEWLLQTGQMENALMQVKQ
ncbi:MAG: TolC family protein [Alphaproteobacteria bacterium]|nr:TolC family protein [Alphaproteobacteria bacterium]